MRTETEIIHKIDEYMNKLVDLRHEDEEAANCYGIIDALLWVIGDESGAPI